MAIYTYICNICNLFLNFTVQLSTAKCTGKIEMALPFCLFLGTRHPFRANSSDVGHFMELTRPSRSDSRIITFYLLSLPICDGRIPRGRPIQ